MSRRRITEEEKARAIDLRRVHRLGLDAIQQATGISVGTLSILLRPYPLSRREIAAAVDAGRARSSLVRWAGHIKGAPTKPADHPWRVGVVAYRVWPDGTPHRLGRGEARALIAARGRVPVVVLQGPGDSYEVPDAFRLRRRGLEVLVLVTVGLHAGRASVVLGSDVVEMVRGETPRWVPLSHVAPISYQHIASDLLHPGAAALILTTAQATGLAAFLARTQAALAVRHSGQIRAVLGEQWISQMWGHGVRATPRLVDVPSWSLEQSRVTGADGARVRAYETPVPITAPRVRAASADPGPVVDALSNQ